MPPLLWAFFLAIGLGTGSTVTVGPVKALVEKGAKLGALPPEYRAWSAPLYDATAVKGKCEVRVWAVAPEKVWIRLPDEEVFDTAWHRDFVVEEGTWLNVPLGFVTKDGLVRRDVRFSCLPERRER